jgi:hypothetical protein
MTSRTASGAWYAASRSGSAAAAEGGGDEHGPSGAADLTQGTAETDAPPRPIGAEPL